MNIFKQAACLLVAGAFAQNAFAQTTKAQENKKDTIQITSLRPVKGTTDINIVTQKGDTLTLTEALNDYESGYVTPDFTFGETKASGKTPFFIDAGKRVYTAEIPDSSRITSLQRLTDKSFWMGRRNKHGELVAKF